MPLQLRSGPNLIRRVSLRFWMVKSNVQLRLVRQVLQRVCITQQ